MVGMVLMFLIMAVATGDIALRGYPRWWLWSLAFTFCVSTVLTCAVPLLIRDSLYLRLDKEGLEICSIFGRKVRIKWTEIELLELRDAAYDGGRTIEIEYSTPDGPRFRLLQSVYQEQMDVIFGALGKWREMYRQRRA
jgi:hypothetical protein